MVKVFVFAAEARDLLEEPLGRDELREAEGRIATIVSGQRVGRVTRDAIAAHESAVAAALMVADIPPYGW